MDRSKLVVADVELFENYFLLMMRKVSNGQSIVFEKFNDSPLDVHSMGHILSKYTIVTFNGINYDELIIAGALAGYSNSTLKKMSNAIIEERKMPWVVRKQFGVPAVKMDHIDLISVAPLRGSLKIYAGRAHAPHLQNLPIYHDAIIVPENIQPLKTYCGYDLDDTQILLEHLVGEIELRESLSEEYGVDVRSKSEAQIAEMVIKKDLDHKYDIRARKPKIAAGTEYLYQPPDNLVFSTEVMQELFGDFLGHPFFVKDTGHIEMPPILKGRKLQLGGTTYKIGVGGLHSCEKSVSHYAGDGILRDIDVESFYPRIILNNQLCPKHLGKPFLSVYEAIVDKRLKAKHAKKKIVSDGLKIVVNGSFGKLGNKYSALYSPNLMMQVTVTGQLSLLMLIERLELAGISVVSANTDGIVLKMRKDQEALSNEIISDWEFDTDYKMEATDYISLHSRDVNNYIAIKPKGVKGKGAFADRSDHFYKLRSNPNNEICSEAVRQFLKAGTPVEQTIRACADIRRFIALRTVTGGAVKEGVELGKAIRWYYGKYELDAIYYVKNGNKVPKSDGAVPIMDLPDTFPDDVDYDRYIAEAQKALKGVGWK